MTMTAYTHTARAELNIDQMIKKNHDMATRLEVYRKIVQKTRPDLETHHRLV